MARINLQKKRARYLAKAKGQGLVEYALILLLVAIIVVVAVRTVGTTTNSTYENINGSLINAGK